MIKYLKIYSCLVKFAAIEETAYRFSFFLEWIVEFGYMLVSFLFLKVVFFNIQQLAGWNFNQMLVLLGVSTIFLETLLGLVFIFNLRRLPLKIQNGDLDLLLLKPINSQFAASLWKPYFAFIPSLVPGLVAIIIGFNKLGFQPNFVLLFLFLIAFINAFIIAYSLGLIIVSLSFWFINANPLANLAEKIIIMSEKPYSIYTGVFKILFLVFIPLFFMVSFPAKILLGNFNWHYFILSFILSTSFLKFSAYFWRLGLKHYSSASS